MPRYGNSAKVSVGCVRRPIDIERREYLSGEAAQLCRRARLLRRGARDASADLITVTIGANDVGLPSDAEGCEVKSADPPPCTDEFVVGNVDRISQLIAAQLPVWGELIDQLRVTAPHARIVVVGYGTFVRPGGCFPAQPVLPRDADFICNPN